jgi:oxaloacetate decarboxylase alpha subunit
VAQSGLRRAYIQDGDGGRLCPEIHIIDTTLRDGQLSLWALGMKTGAMLAIAGQMDQCGFESLEFFGFAGFLKYVREHKENPFDWLRLGAKKFRRTRLRYHGGRSSGFEKIPRTVRALLIERVVAHGITLTRSSDPWNDYEKTGPGLHPQGRFFAGAEKKLT